MAIDYPANPTVGQLFVAAGVVWNWDGVKWAPSGINVAYLPLSGGTLTGNLQLQYVVGDVSPAVNAGGNLGSASLRWGTVFTSDLVLNNGVGDWTIVEGEDDLFLYNNKKERIYKFALIEVETAPPRKA